MDQSTMSSLSARTMNNFDITESFIWFCCQCNVPLFGPMSFMSTPKCVNGWCTHSCCKNCPKEYRKTEDKTFKRKTGARSSEGTRISYTQAAPPRPYPGYEAPAEPRPGLTHTPATAHSFAAPGTASARYTLDSAPLPGSTFENASCIAPQSLIFDSTTTTFYEDSLPIPNSGYPSFGFPTYPCPPSAPLSTSTLGFDFDTAVTTSFDDPEYEEQLDVAGASITSQDHIAALQMDRDLVQVSQVAGSTPNPVQGNDVHAASAHRGKRPREASPDVSVKAACKAPSQRPVKRTAGQKDDRILTCPFVWVDHDRHQKCLKLKLRRIRDVKQHLHRTHEQPYYCRRCKAVPKDGADSAEAQEHDRSDTRCTNREHAAIPDGVTKSQFDSMKKSKADLVTQWHYIWDVLFLDAVETKPRSPFLTERLSHDITAFIVFSQTQGRRILQAAPSLTAREIELVMSGMEVVLDAWASRRKDCLDT